jgi:uncharacterized YigZ family protein
MTEMKDTYYSIEKPCSGYFKDKGSKFYAYAYPVINEEEIKIHQEELRKQHHDARHHVYAFVLGYDENIFRASDDGEPANSSGAPVLGQIRSFNLTNVLIVVVRYFGGTKLGIPGLINAYKSAAADALNQANIVTYYQMQYFKIYFDYPMMDQINRLINDAKLTVLEREFTESCYLKLGVRLSQAETILQRIRESHEIRLKLL